MEKLKGRLCRHLSCRIGRIAIRMKSFYLFIYFHLCCDNMDLAIVSTVTTLIYQKSGCWKATATQAAEICQSNV